MVIGVVKYEGYIYGLEKHEELISLIKSCAKGTLEDERKLLQHKHIDANDVHMGGSRRLGTGYYAKKTKT